MASFSRGAPSPFQTTTDSRGEAPCLLQERSLHRRSTFVTEHFTFVPGNHASASRGKAPRLLHRALCVPQEALTSSLRRYHLLTDVQPRSVFVPPSRTPSQGRHFETGQSIRLPPRRNSPITNKSLGRLPVEGRRKQHGAP